MIIWSLLCGLASAAPSEVGSVHPYGIGFAAGFPVSATFKWMPDDHQGVSVHLGPTLVSAGVHTRVQYDAQVRRLKHWDFADLSIGWHAGALVNFVFGQAAQKRAVRLGAFAGVSVELKLVPAPVSVFAEAAPVLYPLDLVPGSQFLPVGLNIAVGARWFFGKRRARPAEVEAPSEPLTPAEVPALGQPEGASQGVAPLATPAPTPQPQEGGDARPTEPRPTDPPEPEPPQPEPPQVQPEAEAQKGSLSEASDAASERMNQAGPSSPSTSAR